MISCLSVQGTGCDRENGQPVLTELARLLSKCVSLLVTNKCDRTKIVMRSELV
jgi:hypothetical protein